MNTAEIVVRKMQSHSSPKILNFPRESVRQAREAAELHSQGQVLPLNVTGGDVLGIGIAGSDLGYNLRDLSWGVAFISVLAVIAIELRKLCEVSIPAERFLDRLAVEDIGIGSQLDAMVRHAAPNVAHEGLGVLTGALADQERGNELSIRVQGDEYPLIAKLCRIVFADMAGLLHQEGPDFIALQTAAGQFAHFFVHQLFAAFAREYQQAHDSVPVQAREPFCGSDRAAFKKASQRPRSGIRAGTHGSKGRSGLRFAESNVAGLAAPTLNAALTEVPKPLAGLVLAFKAGHGFSPLDFSAELGHNEFGSGSWLTPRSGLALPTALTGDRAVSCYLTSWWRSGHGLLPRFSCRSALIQQSGSYLRPKSFGYLRGPCMVQRETLLRTQECKRSACVASYNLALICEPLQDGVEERQRVPHACEVVSPACKGVPNFNGTHRPASRIDYSSYQISPLDFCLYLLAQSILKSNFGRFQFRNLHIKSFALIDRKGFLHSYLFEGFLNGVGHDN